MIKKFLRTKYLKTKDGHMGVTMAIGGTFIVGMLLILRFLFYKDLMNEAKDIVSTALVDSNLAISVPNADILGSSGTIVLNTSDNLYKSYEKSLKQNLQLNDDLTAKEGTTCSEVMASGVTIDTLIIYNVNGNDVTVTQYLSNGNMSTTTYSGGKGTITAPNGAPITRTGVYSQIHFKIKMFNFEKEVKSGKYTDIYVTG